MKDPIQVILDTAYKNTVSSGTTGPVSIGVLVDLEFAPDAGGHVRSWKRFAEAAGRHTGPRTGPRTDPAAGGFDLTVYFLQPENAGIPAGIPAGPATEGGREAAPHVRIETVPAVSGTRRRGLVHEAGHTDLARFHPTLADRLARHDVLHATSCFAFSETAVAVGRRTGAALVGSLHTDVPAGTPASLLVRASGEDGIVVPDQRVATWIESAAPLVEDAGLRRRMGRQARRDVESRARSRDRVFAEDLLPVWLEAASDSGSRAGSHAGSHAAARAG